MKYFRIKYNNLKTFATGREVSLLQMLGTNVKILRKATKQEYIEQEAKSEQP